MNYISSGINFINFLESLCKHEHGKGFDAADRFTELTSKEFDDNTNYALGYVLRNFSQHGQLIVSLHLNNKKESQICFDLYQLLNPVFVGINARLKERLEEIFNFLSDRDCGVVRLSYAFLIDSFHASICRLYHRFLEIFVPYVECCMEAVRKRLDESSEKVIFDSRYGSYSILLETIDEDYNAHLLMGKPEQSIALLRAETCMALEDASKAEAKVESFRKDFVPLSEA